MKSEVEELKESISRVQSLRLETTQENIRLKEILLEMRNDLQYIRDSKGLSITKMNPGKFCFKWYKKIGEILNLSDDENP